MTLPAPQPAPDAPADLDRDVHFALRDEAVDLSARVMRDATRCRPILGYLRMTGLAVVLLTVFAVVQSIPMPQAVSVSIYVLTTVALVVFFLGRGRREKLANERLMSSFRGVSEPSYRLRAVGPAARLHGLAEYLAGESDVFEPHIFRVVRARRPGAQDVLAFTVVLLALIGVLGGIARVFHLWGQPLGMAMPWLAVALSYVVWSFLWPTYLRIVPGRLDLLQYSLLGTGKPTIRSFDLTTARVLVRIPGFAVVDLPDNAGRHIFDVGPLVGREPLAFERAILTAARSLAPAPGVPDDALTG